MSPALTFTVAQFDLNNSPDEPALFTSEAAMLEWLSTKLDDGTTTTPLYPRLSDEDLETHAKAFLHAFDTAHEDLSPSDLRHLMRFGRFSPPTDIVRVWDIKFTPHS